MAGKRRVVETLLERHGTTFADEAGIPLGRNTPSPLFRLLCLSLLLSARIRSGIAVAAAVALADAGWTTADRMAASSWEERTRVLNGSGYARYDERTSRSLGNTAELVIERYRGDLRRLRAEADGDPDAARRMLTGFSGIGPLGADVFLREAQVVWTEFLPFADRRTLEVARELGLGDSADALHGLAGDEETFTRLVAALVRSGLAHDTGDILGA